MNRADIVVEGGKVPPLVKTGNARCGAECPNEGSIMKKQYGVAPVKQDEYTKAAGETGGGGRVDRPLFKIDDGGGEGFNDQIITGGIFTLPDAKETKEATMMAGIRPLGILVTKELLAHLPPSFSSEHIGMLIPFFAFSMHKRFGLTYTDRICPSSVRAGRCDICDGRVELFRSEEYKSGKIQKDDIIKNGGYGQRQMALVVARVYFDGEDKGVMLFPTALTNELAANARRDNFFDLVDVLMSPKKMEVGEDLPTDYYANGDGARWLVVEWVRATYQEDAKGPAGEQKSKRPPHPFWKLSKITPAKSLKGVGKASDIWWPEITVKGKKVDSIEAVDILGLLNFTPKDELAKVAREKTDSLLKPKAPAEDGAARYEEDAPPVNRGPAPSWEQIVAMDGEDLILCGVKFGGNKEDLVLASQVNIQTLRRGVAKLCGVKPTPVGAVALQAADETVIDDPTPF